MSKQDKQDNLEYHLDTGISLEGLTGLPSDLKEDVVFLNACVGAVVTYSKVKGGLGMHEHRKFFRFREAVQKALDSEETTIADIDSEAFKTFLKWWNEQKPDAGINEMVIRVDKKIVEAVSNHDKVLNEGKS